MIRILKFLWCEFWGHDYLTLDMPPNDRIQFIAKCQKCDHLFWQLGPKE